MKHPNDPRIDDDERSLLREAVEMDLNAVVFALQLIAQHRLAEQADRAAMN